jgi:hypothetical protein
MVFSPPLPGGEKYPKAAEVASANCLDKRLIQRKNHIEAYGCPQTCALSKDKNPKGDHSQNLHAQ